MTSFELKTSQHTTTALKKMQGGRLVCLIYGITCLFQWTMINYIKCLLNSTGLLRSPNSHHGWIKDAIPCYRRHLSSTRLHHQSHKIITVTHTPPFKNKKLHGKILMYWCIYYGPCTYSVKGPWNKSLNFYFPTKHVIPKCLKVSHSLSQCMHLTFWEGKKNAMYI